MKRITQWKAKLLLTATYLCALLLFWYFRLPCLLIAAFHIPCPGCGMSRAFFCALQLDFSRAFSYHPMFWSVPVLYLYFLFDGKLLRNKQVDRAVLLLIGLGFIVQWIVKLLQIS